MPLEATGRARSGAAVDPGTGEEFIVRDRTGLTLGDRVARNNMRATPDLGIEVGASENGVARIAPRQAAPVSRAPETGTYELVETGPGPDRFKADLALLDAKLHSPFSLLGVKPDASAKDITAAYEALQEKAAANPSRRVGKQVELQNAAYRLLTEHRPEFDAHFKTSGQYEWNNSRVQKTLDAIGQASEYGRDLVASPFKGAAEIPGVLGKAGKQLFRGNPLKAAGTLLAGVGKVVSPMRDAVVDPLVDYIPKAGGLAGKATGAAIGGAKFAAGAIEDARNFYTAEEDARLAQNPAAPAAKPAAAAAKERIPNPYKVLELPQDATQAQIDAKLADAKQFMAKAERAFTDEKRMNGVASTETVATMEANDAIMKRVEEAHARLSDPKARQMIDTALAKAQAQAAKAAAAEAPVKQAAPENIIKPVAETPRPTRSADSMEAFAAMREQGAGFESPSAARPQPAAPAAKSTLSTEMGAYVDAATGNAPQASLPSAESALAKPKTTAPVAEPAAPAAGGSKPGIKTNTAAIGGNAAAAAMDAVNLGEAIYTGNTERIISTGSSTALNLAAVTDEILKGAGKSAGSFARYAGPAGYLLAAGNTATEVYELHATNAIDAKSKSTEVTVENSLAITAGIVVGIAVGTVASGGTLLVGIAAAAAGSAVAAGVKAGAGYIGDKIHGAMYGWQDEMYKANLDSKINMKALALTTFRKELADPKTGEIDWSNEKTVNKIGYLLNREQEKQEAIMRENDSYVPIVLRSDHSVVAQEEARTKIKQIAEARLEHKQFVAEFNLNKSHNEAVAKINSLSKTGELTLADLDRDGDGKLTAKDKELIAKHIGDERLSNSLFDTLKKSSVDFDGRAIAAATPQQAEQPSPSIPPAATTPAAATPRVASSAPVQPAPDEQAAAEAEAAKKKKDAEQNPIMALLSGIGGFIGSILTAIIALFTGPTAEERQSALAQSIKQKTGIDIQSKNGMDISKGDANRDGKIDAQEFKKLKTALDNNPELVGALSQALIDQGVKLDTSSNYALAPTPKGDGAQKSNGQAKGG